MSFAGERRSTEEGISPPSSTFRAEPRRKQPASAALAGRHPRPRRKACGRASCGWMPLHPALNVSLVREESCIRRSPCALRAIGFFLPGEKAIHLREQRQAQARLSVQRFQAEGVPMPGVAMRNFEISNPTATCLQAGRNLLPHTCPGIANPLGRLHRLPLVLAAATHLRPSKSNAPTGNDTFNPLPHSLSRLLSVPIP